MRDHAEKLVHLLKRAGFTQRIEQDSISYLAQMNISLSQIFQYLAEFQFSHANFLTSDAEVEIYKQFEQLSIDINEQLAGIHSTTLDDLYECETSIQDEINDLQDELNCAEKLCQSLKDRNEAVGNSIALAESKLLESQSRTSELGSIDDQLNMNLSALSQQLDLIKKENLDMLKRGYVPDPDISWINEIVDRTNEQLVSLQDFYNDSSKTHEALTSEHLNEVRCLYETWQSAHLKNINKRAEAAKTTAQVTKLNNLLRELYSSSTPDITSHFDIERVKREGLDAETEANQIIQTLVRPLVQDLADIKVRQQFYDHIDRIRVQECSILKNRLHKIIQCLKLLIAVSTSSYFASIQESKKVRDLYIASKSIIHILELMLAFKMDSVDSAYLAELNTVQKEDRFLWLLKQFSGNDSPLCSLDSLKQDAVNACSISDKKSYQSTPDFPATVMNLNNIIGTTVQKVVSDAAIVQPEFVLAPKILFDHQEQVKRAVNDLKAQMATLS